MSHMVIDGESITVTDVDCDSFTLGTAYVTPDGGGAYLNTQVKSGDVVTVYLDPEDLIALTEFCARAVGAEPPLVWRECKPGEVQVGWLVERRNGTVAHRGVATEVPDGFIRALTGTGLPVTLWHSGIDPDNGWSLWTTAPAPEYTPEERALRDLLSDLDPETLAKVVTAAKAAYGGGPK